MNLFPKYILLNGNRTAVADLLKIPPKCEGWEQEWRGFLAEWYAPVDFIEVSTSGSTGAPKKVRLKKTFVAESALRTLHFFQLNEGDRILHCLPCRYIAGKLMLVRAIVGKLDLHMADPSTDFSFLQTSKFKFTAMVPNQVGKIPDPAFCALDFLLIGGDAVPQQLENQLQQLPTACYSSYGMTETATHIALRRLNGMDADGFYHCLKGIRVSVSERGCLQIALPGLEPPVLQTTDLAEVLDEKTFRVLGRSDNVIVSGGIKFSPEQIEQKLSPHISLPFMVSSLPHATLGKQLLLVVEADEQPGGADFLHSVCKQWLKKYEQPRQIRFVAHLPRTGNGKIDRRFQFAP